MSEARLRFTCQIAGPPEVVFDLIADLPNYGRWLPDSSAFGGTVDVTPYPVRLGTTYVEAGIRYTLERTEAGTAVLRELDLTIDLRGLLKLLRPALLSGFRKEN